MFRSDVCLFVKFDTYYNTDYFYNYTIFHDKHHSTFSANQTMEIPSGSSRKILNNAAMLFRSARVEISIISNFNQKNV